MRKKTVTCDVGIAQCEDETVKYEKKVREPLNVRKELSRIMLELHNMKMEPSNVEKKKVREPPNVIKELSYVMSKLHNVRMESSSVRKK